MPVIYSFNNSGSSSSGGGGCTNSSSGKYAGGCDGVDSRHAGGNNRLVVVVVIVLVVVMMVVVQTMVCFSHIAIMKPVMCTKQKSLVHLEFYFINLLLLFDTLYRYVIMLYPRHALSR